MSRGEVVSNQSSVIRLFGSGGSVRSVALIAMFLAFASSASAGFDEQRSKMAATIVNQPEAAIQNLLKSGIDEGKAVLAIYEAQRWLRQNQTQDAMTLYLAARAAELGGDLKAAISLYQQYVRQGDLKSDTADEAVYAVYTLLLDRLDDSTGAYAFSKTEGGRLLVCPRAKQFDRWYLDEAVRRGDVLAVARRLTEASRAGYPNDLLIARYDNYFRWIAQRVNSGIGYRRDGELAQDIFDAYKDLLAVMSIDEELKLQVDWAISVRKYVLAKSDKKEAAPPIAEAKALLAKYPDNAPRVFIGWAGGTKDNHPNHVGETSLYWAEDIDAKMAPIVDALKRLPADEQSRVYASMMSGWREPNRVSLNECKVFNEYLKANPKLVQSESAGSPLTKDVWSYSVEEAQKLAPSIELNRHPNSSIIRAMAAGGKDLDKILAALKGPEAWRLSSRNMNGDDVADRLWHYCGRPGGNEKRDKEKNALAAFVKGREYKVNVKPSSPSNQRVAEFKKLWADYQSPKPGIPGVYDELKKLLQFTPEALPELLMDPSPEAQQLARDAIGHPQGMTGPDPMWKEIDRWKQIHTGHYDPLMMMYVNHERGVENLKNRYPKKCNPHPLESTLRNAVVELMKQNRLESWHVITWVNTQWPENNEEQVKVAQQIFKSPAWRDLSFEARFSLREWFKKDAMTPAQVAWIDAGNAKEFCRDLMELTKDSDAVTTAAALSKAIAGVKKSPVRIGIQGLDKLAEVSYEVFAAPGVIEQVLDIADGLRFSAPQQNERPPFANRLYQYVEKNRDPLVVQRTSACLWSYASTEARGDLTRNKLLPLAASLLERAPAAASAFARSGVDFLSRSRGAYGFNPKEHIPAVQALLGKAAMQLGLVTIPVSRTHPAYPIYKSQADWMTASEDSAWALLNATDKDGKSNWEELMPNHRKMSVEYMMWVLKRVIYSRDDARMEQVIKPMLEWAKEPGSPWTTEQKLDLDIAYGDIAMQLGQISNAHKIFLKTQQNPAYANSVARHKATLRRIMVERVAKRFDDALETINELEMEKIPELWADARYARAEVYYDMEEYDNAADDIESILAREPDHGEAKIMQGKVQLKRKKLMEASELDVGSKNAKNTLVPGENLKVTLVDPTLAVSGAGTEVEVSVWTTSGDKENFFLRQFGDQKTKFRGEVRTALGAPNPDDDVLQVIGDDEIWYAYSERFRKKMNDMEEQRGGPITVRSDAVLMASARKLLSEQEQRVADMEAKMAAISVHNRNMSESAKAALAQAAVAKEVSENTATREDRARTEARQKAELTESLLRDRVKPGKAINIRVIDPDASRTAGIDEVAVSIESSSGDSIGRIVLKETGTHTGWFEGSVPTDGAQAMAFAQNTEPGRNPNMVISPKTDYPAWRPVPASGGKPEFKIDLNDNVPIGDMTITARETGAKLKKFVLQTGMNAKEMATVAVYPNNDTTLEKPYSPSEIIRNDSDDYHNNDRRSVYDLRDLQDHLSRGWLNQQYAQGVAGNVTGPSQALGDELYKKVRWRRNDRHDYSHVIYRFRGYFYEPRDVTRRFKVDLGKFQIPKDMHSSVKSNPQFLLAVDGYPITSKDSPGNLEGERNLRAGLHTFEVWATGWSGCIGFGRGMKLLANLSDPEQLTDCPDSFFDPDSFPKDVLSQRNSKASITADADGTQFNVKFAPGSRARLLNLVLVDQEGPVPALSKISLREPDGKKVLPVEQDYAELNKNDRLEILTGDKVAVRYVDDRFVDKAKEKHERLLHVSFSDGACEFVFFEMRKKFNGQIFVDDPYYEGLLRFAYGKPITLKVNDPDMDMTDQPDKVSVVLESKNGGKKKFVATETEDSSGIFQVQIVPVPGEPANENQFKVAKGEKIYAVYRDEENVLPGVPTDRFSSIENAVYKTPILRISHSEVEPLDFDKFDPKSRDPSLRPPAMRGLSIGFATMEEKLAEARAERNKASQGLLKDESRITVDTGGLIQPAWILKYSWGDPANPPQGGIRSVLGREMAFEIEAPHLALRSGSSVEVYLQTETGRQQGDLLGGSLDGGDAGGGFDINVPGTIKLNAGLAGPNAIGGFAMGATVPLVPIYVGAGYGGAPGLQTSEQAAGRLRAAYWDRSSNVFSCRVPLITGFLPEEGVLPPEEIESRREAKMPVPSNHALVVKPADTIYVGVKYQDESGAEKWLTGSAQVISHPVLDVMDEDYREEATTAYVGESLNIRVVDLGGDVSDESDTVRVMMRARSGALYPFELLEVDNHSGVFRGSCELSYVKKSASTNQTDYSVKTEGFPVVYGDAMAVGYTDKLKQSARTRGLIVQKGADGDILPFSKKYDDPEIAQRTQFSLAEAYLEMAKRHRKLGEKELAEDEYARAKGMLEKAMDMFRDPATRAQAEYLLGNLTQEEADTTDDKELKEDRYRAALSRYLRVTGSYPDTLPASKAQFKIATVYERMNEPEIAAQEYVKLAYKYPDSEFLALSMARLGTHFQKKASGYEKQAKELLAKGEAGDKDAAFDAQAMEKMYVKEYMKSAEIFSRLQERFPDHELAGEAGLRAGQAYMRAKETRDALNAFKRVFEHEGYDGPKIRAQAMYWAGLCYEALREEMAAYSIYKRLTYDFPESEWASFARSQLSSEKLLNIELGIEEKRVEEGR